ncbi:MAG: UDP-N-acetylmuramoyl-L-alanine--D-glutamate ligase [Bacteroidales bacterium]|nr:UDP-N-acetylmuramoyl-L-alanine--D-glutamate ligase [Bacteroidales bacterium]
MNNSEKFNSFRKQYPLFVYEDFKYSIDEKGLKIEFTFINGEHIFSPTLLVEKKDFFSFSHLSKEQLDLLIFNMGMVELISYWKAFCSPRVVIKPYALKKEQIDFYKKLYYNGLGEFFYVNGINVSQEEFLNIENYDNNYTIAQSFEVEDRYIVPIGGGKDSVVTMDLLLSANRDVVPFIINPRGATVDCCSIAGFSQEKTLTCKRVIDAHLLELNAQGCLNGHTPFSAMLAFTTLLISALTKRKYIALSNEDSASESTVKGSEVNHQYSKSLEFENDFRAYVAKFVSEDFYYFSFLRPLSELHIAKLFSKLSYQSVFKSCNAGSKQNIWCGKCPKCLFAFIILSPFVSKEELIAIFSKNLFEDKDLEEYFLQLCGERQTKPFECVGTVSEVKAALALCLRNRKEDYENDYLMKIFQRISRADECFEKLNERVFFELSNNHNLPERDLEIFSNSHLATKKAGLIKLLKPHKIAILGYGREGQSTHKLIKSLLPEKEVLIADDKSLMADCTLQDPRLENYTLYIKTPGISMKKLQALDRNKITSQTDIFLQLYSAQTIGITGTKGKSTTSNLVYKILADQGFDVLLAGNIGVPLLDILPSIKEDTIIVAELSAHQLQFIHTSPKVSILLNLFEEHLDHFDGYEQYKESKYNIATKQTKQGVFIFNKDSKEIKALLEKTQLQSRQKPFSKEEATIEANYLKGEHNQMNILSAILASQEFGTKKEEAETTAKNFQPLAHRLEYVGEKNGVTYYNDSISTIPQATIEALKALKKVQTLILGGMDRGIDYSPLVEQIGEFEVKNIAFVGQAGKRIYKEMKEKANNYNCLLSDDYKEIVSWCKANTQKEKICLLSPAASSYDMFTNFEHRGEVFKQLISEI